MSKTINSAMAGTVFRIEVKPGDTFDFGDVVVVLESMKMEINIEADDAGTVESLLLKEGDMVDEGTPILSYN
ncbi:acetyl-CoA carboxylase biotin carboxyl carrier protein subunit [Amorphus sp. 3PC139-8]|uniref:acetyl-CoA carboxylase biotin carboxyl carrier protein subunit n=1 Tax=Amorphus sp. 3PC139-8 TaxID=2735676 RepID=UPI00345D38D9